MDDLINRQAAVNIVDFECGEWKGLAKTIIDGFEALPTVDALKVVRCKDCKLFKTASCAMGFDTDEAMYCGYAERRQNG
jgi:hypothetical protein